MTQKSVEPRYAKTCTQKQESGTTMQNNGIQCSFPNRKNYPLRSPVNPTHFEGFI